MGASGMMGEPKQGAGTSEVTEQEGASWGRGVGIFRDHPTLLLSLLYLYVSGVGMGYSAILYGSFGINIFDYFEITDFLLAAFKNPIVIAANAIMGTILFGLVVLSFATHPRIMVVSAPFRPGGRPRIDDTRIRLRRRIYLYTGLVGVVSILTALVVNANGAASSIKDGETPSVDVWYRSFSGSAGQVKEPNLRLIGATERAVFFYDVDAKPKRTVVIPQTQLVSIAVPEQD